MNTEKRIKRVWVGTGDEPPAAQIAETRRKLDGALGRLWRTDIGKGLSPWRSFYASLAAQLPIEVGYVPPLVIEYEDGTAVMEARGGETNGRRIVVNAATMHSRPVEEIMSVILHELEHCVRRHLPRRAGRDPFLWNVATDAVINATLAAEGLTVEGAILLPDVKPDDLEEEVYNRLLQTGRSTGGQEGMGWAARHAGQMDIAGTPAGEVEELDPEAVVQAAAAAAQMAGRLPAHVEQLLEVRRRVVPPWTSVLRRHLVDGLSVKRTWARLSRRSPWLPAPVPGRKPQPRAIGVVVDTSGSMTDGTLVRVFEVVAGVAAAVGCRIRVWQCDTEVTGPVEYAPENLPDQWEVHGRGGTLMEAAAEAVAAAPCPVVLWCTDGLWGDLPSLPDGCRHICVLAGRCAEAPCLPWTAVVRAEEEA